ncbi:PEP-CTERM sorting domain-containing protein, partial [Planctomycetota bacterium]
HFIGYSLISNGTLFGGQARTGLFNGPYDVEVSPLGYIYVADRSNNRIQVFTPEPSSLLLLSFGAIILRKRK